MGPRRFAELDDPGHLKIAMNFTVRPRGTGALVSTETRIAATSRRAKLRFAAYRLLVGPFSALIRRRMMAVLRAEVALDTALPGSHPCSAGRAKDRG